MFNQIRNIDLEDEEWRWARSMHFISQMDEAETGNISTVREDTQGAVSRQIPPPPQMAKKTEPAVSIVNEYNSFNLANITPPVAPKLKQPDNLLDEFQNLRGLVKESLAD